MTYTGEERRKFPRIKGRFIVSYRILEKEENCDTSQTKNMGLGGMLLTTNKEFAPGTNLLLEIRLPFDPEPIKIIAKVLESHEITKDLIYDTRLQFLEIDEKHRDTVHQTIDYYLKRE